MKKLSMFQVFDFGGWAASKSFMVQSAKFNGKKGCVTLDVIIPCQMYTVYLYTSIYTHLKNHKYLFHV